VITAIVLAAVRISPKSGLISMRQSPCAFIASASEAKVGPASNNMAISTKKVTGYAFPVTSVPLDTGRFKSAY
jgi:hypothetical protein